MNTALGAVNPNGNGLLHKKNAPVQGHKEDSLKSFYNILRQNYLPVIFIVLGCIIATVVYVLNAKDIYKSTSTIKINRPQGSILSSSLIPEFNDFITDRFISNEIEILKSYKIRENVAKGLLDSFKVNPVKENFYYIFDRSSSGESNLKTDREIAENLAGIVQIDQKRGLDVVDITVESPAKNEAKMIANLYADTYKSYSLDLSKEELITLTSYLDKEREKKLRDLTNSEAALQDFQQRGGIVLLDAQVRNLVENISQLEAEKNAAKIELTANENAYSSLTGELKRLDPTLMDYLNSQVSESYVTELQRQIAELEAKRDVESSIPQEEKLRSKTIAEYNKKIEPLKSRLEEKVSEMKSGLFAGTPVERRNLAQKIIETNVDVVANRTRVNTISDMLNRYESKFSQLPSQSIEYAKLERDRKSTEKLYLILEEKFQEARINEKIKLGNVVIVDPAILPLKPSKPNRPLVLAIGTFFGIVLGFGFAFLRNYLDKTIKSPEEIENNGISILSWIPAIDDLKRSQSSQVEFIVANKSHSPAAESFKALRTRIQYSKLEEKPLKTILVTSSIPGEGKTTVSANLAGSFALANKKVVLLDCDLRKPRVHSLFETDRYPGLSDCLFSNASFDEIIRSTVLENMKVITSGTIPPNPSEMLGSKQFLDFLKKLEENFDIIIIDSPPFISVTDAEILFRITDGTILVVQAGKTPSDLFYKTSERMINLNVHNFLGVVLSNFDFKSTYGYNYNYYYYYSNQNSSNSKSSNTVKK